ncbi:hypothetical protein Droror1_Dr00025974 [Drosera rotundifolia]
MESQESAHLAKLSSIDPPKSLADLLSILWSTRDSGLSVSDKFTARSLLRLPSISDVDPVVAAVRVVMRKCMRREGWSRDEVMEMCGSVDGEARQLLVGLLEERWSLWKEEVLRDRHPLPKSGLPYQASTSVSSSPLPVSSFGLSKFPWSWQDRPAPQRSNALVSTRTTADRNMSHLFLLSNQNGHGTLKSLETLPHLTSVTWALGEKTSASSSRAAIITLKLLDNSKPAAEEIEVRFQVTRDAVEAMIQSITNISDQFSKIVTASEIIMQEQQ